MSSPQQVIHPAKLVRGLIEESGLSVIDAAERLNVSRQQLTRLLGKKSGVSPEMALRLESVFGLSAKELLDKQLEFELARARREARKELGRLTPYHGPLARLNKRFVVDRLAAHERDFRAAGILHLYLFGSVARGEATPSSDVDLYFEADPSAEIGLLELGALTKRIEEILGVKTDLVPGDGFKSYVRAEVEREAIKIF